MSFLEGNGTPSMVERGMIRPPSARLGPITPEERKAIIAKSPVKGKYDTTVDPESAYEMLAAAHAVGTAAASVSAPDAPGAPSSAPRPAAAACWLARSAACSAPSSAPTARAGSRLSPGQLDRARGHPHGHQPGRRPGRRRPRQVARRLDGRLGRPRHRARHARRHLAAVSRGCRESPASSHCAGSEIAVIPCFGRFASARRQR